MTLCPDDPAPVVAAPASSNLGGWLLLGLLLGILVAEVILIGSHRPTISQWVARKTRGKPWFKFFAAGIIGGLLWHLLQGGPL